MNQAMEFLTRQRRVHSAVWVAVATIVLLFVWGPGPFGTNPRDATEDPERNACQVARITIATAAEYYWVETGRFPQSQEELAGDYLVEVDRDWKIKVGATGELVVAPTDGGACSGHAQFDIIDSAP